MKFNFLWKTIIFIYIFIRSLYKGDKNTNARVLNRRTHENAFFNRSSLYSGTPQSREWKAWISEKDIIQNVMLSQTHIYGEWKSDESG